MFASRNQHVQKLILPALENNQWVVCDRYYDATHAYQVASGVPHDRINSIESWLKDLPIPDLTFYLDAPISVCLERLNNRKYKAKLARSVKYFSNVRQNYLDRAKANPDRSVLFRLTVTLKKAMPIFSLNLQIF